MMEYPKYNKVLFCTDFSDNSDYAFEFAYGIAKRHEALLYIFHVIPYNPHQEYVENFVDKDSLIKLQQSIQDNLDKNYNERYVDKIGDTVKYEIVTKTGLEDHEIIQFAKKQGVDIIIMGTHGRTGIEHVFFGSVAEKVIRHSPIPILIIPGKEKLEKA